MKFFFSPSNHDIEQLRVSNKPQTTIRHCTAHYYCLVQWREISCFCPYVVQGRQNWNIDSLSMFGMHKHFFYSYQEYCTGKSNHCPLNSYIADGHPCNNDTAYCYRGACKTHNTECRMLWGEVAVKGTESLLLNSEYQISRKICILDHVTI